MVNRGIVRSLFVRLRPPPQGRNSAMQPSLATNRACFCSFNHSNVYNENRRMQRNGVLDLGIGRRFAPGSALSLKGCLNWQDSTFRGVDGEAVKIKAHVLAPQRQLLRDAEVLPLEEVSTKSLNGNGACWRGKPLGFPEYAVSTKMVVAVDVDEVLGSFLAALNRFIADRYSWNHSVSEYHVYDFFKIWNCSRERGLGRMQLKFTH